MAPLSDPPEDDEASGPALQRLVEGLVDSALLALRRAFSGGDSVIRLRAELLLEVARAMRRESLAESGQVVPVA